MPKTPYPYSSRIVAKTIKDWQSVDSNLIIETSWSPMDVWTTIQTQENIDPNYSLKYRKWEESYLCCPLGFENDVSFDDKQKLGEKLIKPYLTWKKANDEKRRKDEERKEKRERLKKLKKFLA